MSRARNGYRRASWWLSGQPARVVVAECEQAERSKVEPEPVQPAVADATELRHGYTLADVERLTRIAVHRHRSMACDVEERHAAARIAIVERIYVDGLAPESRELLDAGSNAIRDLVQAEHRHNGVPTRDPWAGFGAMLNFQRYWFGASTSPSPEGGVVERLTVWQILSRLKPQHRLALVAFAAVGDREAAARSLGLKPSAFRQHLDGARREFFALWHEGETPSRKWRPDSGPRRLSKPLKPCGTASAYARHRLRKEPVDDACRKAWTAYQKERVAARSCQVPA